MAVKITSTGIDTLQNNTVSSPKIPAYGITTADMPAGSYLQAVNMIYTGRTAYTSYMSDTDVPGCSISITPKESNSKFIITVRSLFEMDDEWNTVFNIQRNGSRINTNNVNDYWCGLSMASQSYNGGDDNSSTPSTLNFTTFDTTGSTAGVPITYKLVSSSTFNMTVWLNRTFSYDNQSGYENSTTEIIVIEVKG